jgi:hypothetical protein
MAAFWVAVRVLFFGMTPLDTAERINVLALNTC